MVNAMNKRSMFHWSTLAGTALAVALAASNAGAAELNLSNVPLFLSPSVAPLNMFVVGRDHKLYYEAYNDASDLNGDGVLDVGFNPNITYYGYFDSFKCYEYDAVQFEPRSRTPDGRCSGLWSGNWLNYVTTSRIDALRKVLYGGKRSLDADSDTILERSHIPQDAHSWGKEYESVARDGYDIREYTPLPLPSTGRRHLFANTTLNGTSTPLMRQVLNSPYRIWEWVSIEQPVAGSRAEHGRSGPSIGTITDYIVRVRVCDPALLEANCKLYPSGSYKPTGLIHEYGENDAMKFGLLTGSYAKNTQGGVLRKRVGSITNEIDPDTGRFLNTAGIIRTLDRLRTTGFTSSYSYTDSNDNCGWIVDGPISSGQCRMWGNPVAEMLYETVRYFAGKGSPTSAFAISGSTDPDASLGLSLASWNNPYSGTNAAPVCAKPFATIISDINPSYDTDQVPGTSFGSFGGDVSGLDASAVATQIWNHEFGAPGTHFIGQSGSNYDGAPTAKTVNSFANIRGLAPEEPTKNGGYYSASVAHFAAINDLNAAAGEQKMQTFAVALASPLPRIEIPVGTNRKVTLVPFAKSVGGSVSGVNLNGAQGAFQPTNQIVDFYVESITPTSGRFRVNFEDVEQGADHDMDAIALYEYQLVNGNVEVTVTSQYAAGSIVQHMGYVISGTTADGTYLVVRDVDTSASSDPDYFLDTPPAFVGVPPAPSSGTGGWDDNTALPLTSTRTFTPGTGTSATILKGPLWYAAKWGGFQDDNENDIPDLTEEWDDNNDGEPDNYFLVTNALTLSQQLREAFEEIVARTSSASSASVNSGSISTTTRVYQARFNTRDWTGQLLAFGVDPNTGAVNINNPLWDASTEIPQPNDRDIITVNDAPSTPDDLPVAFRWNDLDATRRSQLDPTPATAQLILDYLRGDATHEEETAIPRFRARPSKLGDIISSAPVFVGAPRARYRDDLENQPYSAFLVAHRDRREMVYVGANDGMLHGFDANTGAEVFAFIPKPVFPRLRQLADPTYSHQYYVDGSPNSGDVFFSDAWHTVLVGGLGRGGQGIYALDVTNPSALAAAEGNPDNVYMWEFTDENDADLGYTYSQPAIVRLRNGDWAAVFGNGYNNTEADGHASTTGNAVLYIVSIEDGSIIRKLDTGVGMDDDPTGAQRPNGLATPVMVDVDGDRVVDHAYAGDLFGNLWKFDLRATSSTGWDFAFRDAGNRPEPLFVARDANGNRQPITVRPEVARGPYGAGVMVLFGTGKFLEPVDKLTSPTRVQTFYGLLDNNTYTPNDRITARNLLTQQTIDAEGTIDPDGTGPLPSRRVRVTSANAMTGARGWYMDLLSPVNNYEGEKQVTDPAVRGDKVVFTTLIPNSDPCGFGGRSWLMELDLLSGQRLPDTPLDTNGDGVIDENDDYNGDSVSGVQDDQILSRPEILMCLTGNCVDRKLSSGSSGELYEISEVSDRASRGRQSWRQIR